MAPATVQKFNCTLSCKERVRHPATPVGKSFAVSECCLKVDNYAKFCTKETNPSGKRTAFETEMGENVFSLGLVVTFSSITIRWVFIDTRLHPSIPACRHVMWVIGDCRGSPQWSAAKHRKLFRFHVFPRGQQYRTCCHRNLQLEYFGYWAISGVLSHFLSCCKCPIRPEIENQPGMTLWGNLPQRAGRSHEVRFFSLW